MNVLVFAPHNDDEVLGVGGTIYNHAMSGDIITVCEITSGTMYKLLQEEAKQAHQVLKVDKSVFLNLPVGQLRTMDQPIINEMIARVVRDIEPEVAYLPFIGDMHVDHRETTESALVALRPIHCPSIKQIYMYETLSETGWNLTVPEKTFIPNVWVDITESLAKKLEAMSCYKSQVCTYPHPRSQEGIEALAKYRGSTIGVNYAECFMAVRIVK